MRRRKIHVAVKTSERSFQNETTAVPLVISVLYASLATCRYRRNFHIDCLYLKPTVSLRRVSVKKEKKKKKDDRRRS